MNTELVLPFRFDTANGLCIYSFKFSTKDCGEIFGQYGLADKVLILLIKTIASAFVE